MMGRLSIFFLLLSLGCHRSPYLSLSQEKVDDSYLASTHVETPDPRQEHPPLGQRIIIQWVVSSELLQKGVHLDLHLLFWNDTTETVSYPIHHRSGSKVYFLLDDAFEKTKGILTYKAEILTDEGEKVTEWKHKLWVNLISLDSISPPLAEPPQEDLNSPLDRLEELEEKELQDNETYIPEERDGEIYPESVEDLPEGPVEEKRSPINAEG
jgi:hypothetical protein